MAEVEEGDEEDLASEFERLSRLNEELGRKMSALLEEAGLSPEEYRQYFANPDNFTEGQWKLIQKAHEAGGDEIPELKSKKKPKRKPSARKKGKKKFTGKRKGWIQMD